jgi:tRNA G18 (ribose-2'-O)-methylase SpoU
MVAPYADFISSLSKKEIRDELAKIRNPIEIAVYGSKNGFNFGCIVRTGHSFLVKKYWAIDMPQIYEKAMMTARRFDEHLINKVSLQEFLEKNSGRCIVGFERRIGSNLPVEDIRKFKYPEDCILLFGSENFGIPDELLAACTHLVTIPIDGLVADLNVSVAAGIALYDWKNKQLK